MGVVGSLVGIFRRSELPAQMDTTDHWLNRRREYNDERGRLIELEWRTADSFVKTITGLSAGALGLSLAFVEKLAPRPPAYPLLAGGAWLAFAVSLGLILVAHLTGRWSMRRQRRIIYQDQINQAGAARSPEDGESAQTSEPANTWASITSWLDALALLAFLVGTGLLVTFGWLNFPGT